MVFGKKFIYVPILIVLILLQLRWPAKQWGKGKRGLIGKRGTKNPSKPFVKQRLVDQSFLPIVGA